MNRATRFNTQKSENLNMFEQLDLYFESLFLVLISRKCIDLKFK
jgi:hypothetical protein